VELPVHTDTTLYTSYGDYLGRFFAVLALALLILGGVSRILVTLKNDSAAKGRD
jgi:hypothetical protein